MIARMTRTFVRAAGIVGLTAAPAALAHPGVDAQSPWLLKVVHEWLHAVHDEPAALLVLGIVAAAVILAATHRRGKLGRSRDRR